MAAFMDASQAPWGVAAFTSQVTDPAWKKKPSWALIPTADLMIGAAAEHFMAKRAGSTVVVVKGGSHAIYVSQPQAVAALIETAARSVRAH